MKHVSLLLSLLLSTSLFAQTIDSQTSLDSQFANPTNLTDKQMSQAKDFIHQGQKKRIYDEKCKSGACQDTGEGFPVEMLIGKAYSLMGAMVDGGMPKLNKKPDAPAAGEVKNTGTKDGATGGAKGKGEKEEMNDYCMMAAMAYEALGSIIQQSLQKGADSAASKETDEQLRALIQLKETHKARQKTAKWQSYVYGGITACYGGMIAFGAKPDAKLLLKMAGAGALTTLYIKKANKEKNRAEAVQEVIAALDHAGENCNPWTKTSCFCSEKSSKDTYPDYYQEVCVLNKGNFNTPKIAMGCIATTADKKTQFDKECKCKTTNTCMRSPIQGLTSAFNVPSTLMAKANQQFDLLGSGEFDQAELDRASLSMANSAARMKIPDGMVSSPTLTDEQKKLAENLATVMPPQLAAVAAASKTGYTGGIKDTAGSASASKLSPKVKAKLAEAIDVNYKQGSGSTDSSSSEPEFTMPTMAQAGEADSSGTEVISFAEQAISKADVSNAPETPIFDIISNRYRMSGWTKLEPVEQK